MRSDLDQGPAREDARHHRVYWRSRRGMLELEFRLLPFVSHCFPGMSPSEQSLYVELLEHEDWEIFDWLQGREVPDDPAMVALVQRIIDYGAMPSAAE